MASPAAAPPSPLRTCLLPATAAGPPPLAPAAAPQTNIEAARHKEEGRVKKVVVTGCLAQRYGAELAEQLPEADLVVG